ncbi:MAG: glycolate oxidase subunit GlcF [gamma proteobacterium symbiont of Bathyaustriella thionipta]|nr:glycolate oxidase subunit GlcF [gamma proteobacterium symbiont of Bathyaustriella thionipta]
MQTQLNQTFLASKAGQQAEQILRSCVHCGFCTANCPTYQLLGDELDGPRGRIYQIKQVLEGEPATATVQQHLDRCLGCRSCETTCPSGVEYYRLLEIGRKQVSLQVKRPVWARLQRFLIRQIIPYPKRFKFLLGTGQNLRPLLPTVIRQMIPERPGRLASWPPARHQRRMLLLDGCAQPALAPAINRTAAQILDRLGISLIKTPRAGCCGALDQHMDALHSARSAMKRNIDAWWPYIEQGAEAILVTASGCLPTLQEYGELLEDDAHYAHKADVVSKLAKDPVEILQSLDVRARQKYLSLKIAFQVPCSLQHHLHLQQAVEALLRKLGFQLHEIAESHLCCGSAGSYSLLQPALSKQLRQRKLKHLLAVQPDMIVTANIGCQHHLQAVSPLPLKHWLELLE